MDGLTLLQHACAARLSVTAERHRLVVRGPRIAADTAKELLTHEPAVLEVLNRRLGTFTDKLHDSSPLPGNSSLSVTSVESKNAVVREWATHRTAAWRNAAECDERVADLVKVCGPEAAADWLRDAGRAWLMAGPNALRRAWRCEWEERAAIREYDAGQRRDDAEVDALCEIIRRRRRETL